MTKDEEGEFRLRPWKPPARNERIAWASAHKIIMPHARTTSRRLAIGAIRRSLRHLKSEIVFNGCLFRDRLECAPLTVLDIRLTGFH